MKKRIKILLIILLLIIPIAICLVNFLNKFLFENKINRILSQVYSEANIEGAIEREVEYLGEDTFGGTLTRKYIIIDKLNEEDYFALSINFRLLKHGAPFYFLNDMSDDKVSIKYAYLECQFEKCNENLLELVENNVFKWTQTSGFKVSFENKQNVLESDIISSKDFLIFKGYEEKIVSSVEIRNKTKIIKTDNHLSIIDVRDLGFIDMLFYENYSIFTREGSIYFLNYDTLEYQEVYKLATIENAEEVSIEKIGNNLVVDISGRESVLILINADLKISIVELNSEKSMDNPYKILVVEDKYLLSFEGNSLKIYNENGSLINDLNMSELIGVEFNSNDFLISKELDDKGRVVIAPLQSEDIFYIDYKLHI
jgi:hypothetical protein